jgi:nucleotide-binding universal stress UspA family protein
MGNILVAYDGSDSSKNALRQVLGIAEAEKHTIKVVNVMLSSEEIGVDTMGQGVIREPAAKMLREAETIAMNEGAKVETDIVQGIAYEEICKLADSDDSSLIVFGRRGLSRLERMLMGSVASRVIGHTGKDVLVVPVRAEAGWKNVVVATDGSKFGDAAVKRAVNFAKTHGGSLTAVTVVDVTEEFYAQVPEAVAKAEEKAKGMLEEVKKKAEAEGLSIETHVLEGDAHKKIVELADEKKADVIIVGSHGRKGIKKVIMGSVAEKVIGLAACPVMVIRA